jgi:hypothetical protein
MRPIEGIERGLASGKHPQTGARLRGVPRDLLAENSRLWHDIQPIINRCA